MKLVSLNIYAGHYLDKSIAHLQSINPDVLCLQELHEADVDKLQGELGMPHAIFVPSTNVTDANNKAGFRLGRIGLGILSKTELTDQQVDFYYKPNAETPIYVQNDGYCWDRALMSAQVQTAEGPIRVSTTHFTWTHDGSASPQQRKDMAAMIDHISKQNVDVLCGDFNAPRGAEIMTHISSRMEDHMIDGVDTTIDQNLHRVRGIKLVVDNVFSRRGLAKVDLQIKDGMSDHKALIAEFLFANLEKNRPHTQLLPLPGKIPRITPDVTSQTDGQDRRR